MAKKAVMRFPRKRKRRNVMKAKRRIKRRRVWVVRHGKALRVTETLKGSSFEHTMLVDVRLSIEEIRKLLTTGFHLARHCDLSEEFEK